MENYFLCNVEDVDGEIDSTNAFYKAIQRNDILVKITKANRDIFSEFIMYNFNECITAGRFPEIVKSAEVKPVFKKNSKTDKNYRLVSILSVISKIFERLILKQLIMLFEQVFSFIVHNTVYSSW